MKFVLPYLLEISPFVVEGQLESECKCVLLSFSGFNIVESTMVDIGVSQDSPRVCITCMQAAFVTAVESSLREWLGIMEGSPRSKASIPLAQ